MHFSCEVEGDGRACGCRFGRAGSPLGDAILLWFVMVTSFRSEDAEVRNAFREGWLQLMQDDLKVIENKIETETPR